MKNEEFFPIGMTMTEHFEKAKADGHEWADKAIEYRKFELYGKADKGRALKLSSAISFGFIWEKTKEGKEYWKEIRDQFLTND
jgi:hypothetical protein